MADKEKVASKLMGLPLEDGNSEEAIEAAEKQKEENDKEVEKELKDAAKVVDDVNTAEPAKPLKEKLVLDESDELNEGFLTEDDDFISDVYNVLSEVAFKYKDVMGHMSNEEIEADFQEAFEWFLTHFIQDELDEALPKDLAKAYKNEPYQVGVGRDHYGYKNIKGKKEPISGVPSGAYDRVGKRVDVDFQNSDYKKITPEEAAQLKKDGKIADLRIVFDGQLVAYRPDGKTAYRADRSWDSNRELYKHNDKIVDHSYQLTFKEIISRAEAIYVANEKPVDQGIRDKRSENPESAYAAYDQTGSSLGTIASGSPYRGNRLDCYTANNLQREQRRLKDITNGLKTAQASLSELEAKQANGEPVVPGLIDRAKEEVSYYENRVKTTQQTINRIKNEIKDFKAALRYRPSQIELRKPFDKLNQLKSALVNADYDLRRAKSEADDLHKSGSRQTREYKHDLESYAKQLRDIKKQMAKLELFLETADEDDAELIKQADAYVDEITNKYNGIQSQIDDLLRKKQEDLEEPLEEAAKITTSFDNYKPWSGAVDTYNTIVKAGKVDELDALIEELYPEGIDETQLNDILWFESDWLFETLGIRGDESIE